LPLDRKEKEEATTSWGPHSEVGFGSAKLIWHAVAPPSSDRAARPRARPKWVFPFFIFFSFSNFFFQPFFLYISYVPNLFYEKVMHTT
jgi:hypothetical protein